MENPAYWGEAERLIWEAIDEHEKAMEDHVCGGSLPLVIATKLEAAGLLVGNKRVQHNHFTRDFQPHTCEACADTNTGRKILESDSS